MKKNMFLFYSAIILTAMFGYGFMHHSNHVSIVSDATPGFAIVELFTSEGCSSCPAAENLSNTIAGENLANVYLLSFHVDYWDNLGWKDKFSNKIYTDRQKEWAGIFKLESIYTPQMVVNGKTEFVGSDENKLRSTIKNELKNASPASIDVSTKMSDTKTVSVSCNIKNSVNNILNIALVQKEAETSVKKGENQGRLLKHINIVRDFKKIKAGSTVSTVTLLIPEGLSQKDFRVIAYVQNSSDFKVIAVKEKEL